MTTIQKLERQIAELKQHEKLRRGRRVWKCPFCARGTQLRNLHLSLMQFYVEPYSCTGGDYWTIGSRPEYKIHCPKCDKDIREIDSDGRGMGYDGPTDFSVKRWLLIHQNQDVFASRKYECMPR